MAAMLEACFFPSTADDCLLLCTGLGGCNFVFGMRRDAIVTGVRLELAGVSISEQNSAKGRDGHRDGPGWRRQDDGRGGDWVGRGLPGPGDWRDYGRSRPAPSRRLWTDDVDRAAPGHRFTPAARRRSRSCAAALRDGPRRAADLGRPRPALRTLRGGAPADSRQFILPRTLRSVRRRRGLRCPRTILRIAYEWRLRHHRRRYSSRRPYV